MPRYLPLILLFAVAAVLRSQQPPPVETPANDALVAHIQNELSGPFPPPDAIPNPQVPHGEWLHGSLDRSPIYPGTSNEFQVYVPAQYNPAQPACFLLKLDGLGPFEATVLDNLIARHELPVIIGIGLTPGAIWKSPAPSSSTPPQAARPALRFNRSYEFDSLNSHFPDFVLGELLPAIQRLTTAEGRAIRLSPRGTDHAVTGASTGGIGSFTLAWLRPDQFTRVYSVIGTFISMRGGHEYPALIRKTDPKPLRIFLEDGAADAWNPLFGSWFDANLNVESALRFAGYDVAHAWGTHGHDGRPGQVIFPDVLRWLWRDYPAPIPPGVSQNSTLAEITLPGEAWQIDPHAFQSAAGLAANSRGEVYVSDTPHGAILRLNPAPQPPTPIAEAGSPVAAQAFGPDGSLYSLVPAARKILVHDARNNATRTFARNIAGRGLVVTHTGALYVTEPGAHSDMPGRLWKLQPDGARTLLDEGLAAPSGLAFSPDGSLLYAAEAATRWVYSFLVQPDGSLTDKQSFDWLHTADLPATSAAEDLAVDTHGNLYVATALGIQVCDQNGRVRAILPLPAPSGPVRSLCFGGAHFDILYATDGQHLFTRRLKIPGLAPWSAPIPFPTQGMG